MRSALTFSAKYLSWSLEMDQNFDSQLGMDVNFYKDPIR